MTTLEIIAGDTVLWVLALGILVCAALAIYLRAATAVYRADPAALARLRDIEAGNEAWRKEMAEELAASNRLKRNKVREARNVGWHIRDVGTGFDCLSPRKHTYVVGQYLETQGFWRLSCDNCKGWNVQKNMGRLAAHHVALNHSINCLERSAQAAKNAQAGA